MGFSVLQKLSREVCYFLPVIELTGWQGGRCPQHPQVTDMARWGSKSAGMLAIQGDEVGWISIINSLAPGRFLCNFR